MNTPETTETRVNGLTGLHAKIGQLVRGELTPAQAQAKIHAMVGSRKLAAQHFSKRKPVIAAMHAAIKRHLDFAKHETLRNIEKHYSAQSAANDGVAFDLIFDQAEFADGLFDAVRKESANTLQTAGNQLFEELGRDDAWTMPDSKAQAFLDTRTNLLKGESLAKISKRISGKFDEISEGRAKTIASTETGAAARNGRRGHPI